MSKKSSNFATQNECYAIMKAQDPKQMPFVSENIGAGMPQQKYYTADEAKGSNSIPFCEKQVVMLSPLARRAGLN